jgi:hypothetical protein
MSRVGGSARLVVLVAMVVAVALGVGLVSWRAASATTRLLDRSDMRFDVLVQRRTEPLGTAGAELRPPEGQPRLSAAQAWSAARAHRQPNGAKPSVRLATFVDPDFPVPSGPGRRLVPVAKRALAWVVVVPDTPVFPLAAQTWGRRNGRLGRLSDVRPTRRSMQAQESRSDGGRTADGAAGGFTGGREPYLKPDAAGVFGAVATSTHRRAVRDAADAFRMFRSSLDQLIQQHHAQLLEHARLGPLIQPAPAVVALPQPGSLAGNRLQGVLVRATTRPATVRLSAETSTVISSLISPVPRVLWRLRLG